MSDKNRKNRLSGKGGFLIIAACAIVLSGICLVVGFCVADTLSWTAEYAVPQNDAASADSDEPSSQDASGSYSDVGEAPVSEADDLDADDPEADDPEAAEETVTLSDEELLELEIQETLDSMSLEDKIAQLFIVTPEAITGVDTVTVAAEISEAAIDKYPVGGIVYFAKNLVSTDQTKEMLSNFNGYSLNRTGLPLFQCVDEEGGSVARIASNSAFGVTDVGNMSEIGATGDASEAYAAGLAIGTYLSELGFNVDFAPVADVWTNPSNTVVQYRSFGSDASLVSEMTTAFLQGIEECGVFGTFKHFPGHGDTDSDTHDGYAYSDKTLEELKECEFLPFEAGIGEGLSFIMVAHIALPNVTGDDTPASMSPTVLSLLRDDLGFGGIIITDALNMEAITENYSPAEAALTALTAGADMLLMPEDFESAYDGVLEAVKNGSLSEDRIDESLTRILKVKLS